MSKRSLIWKIPTALIGILLGLVLLLLAGLSCVLYVSSLRTAVLNKSVVLANEKTDYDIDLQRLHLSPFHHSPLLLYRAYKGEADLPIEIQIDSLFIGHRGQDTLLYAHALRLRGEILTSHSANGLADAADLTSIPIIINDLQLESATFHSDTLIATVGIDVIAAHLELSSPGILIAQGKYPLDRLRLEDAYVGIDIRDTPPDTTAKDTTPLLMAYDVTDGILRNVHFRLTPLGMDIQAGYLATNVLADVGGSVYDARRLDAGNATFELGKLYLPFDTLYGEALTDLAHSMITSNDLHARSQEWGAQLDLQAVALNLQTMQVDVTGDADYKGNQASVQAAYNINSETYDATVHVDRVNLSPFAPDLPPVTLVGDIEARGQGIDIKRPLVSRVKLHLDQAQYDAYNLSHTSFEGATDSVTSLALTMPGLQAEVRSPMPLFTLLDRLPPLVNAVSDSALLSALTSLQDLTVLDTIRARIPAIGVDIALRKGSPVQALIDSTGLDFNELALSLRSDSSETNIRLSPFAFNLSPLRLPTIQAAADITMTEGRTDASLTADTRLTDGAMSFYDLCTDAALRLDLAREGKTLQGTGRLTLDSLSYANKDLGNRTIDMHLSPSQHYANALRADVQPEDIPLDIVDAFVTLTDIDIQGAVRASASVDGLPHQTDISAEVQPLGVAAEYKPYKVGFRLGETPIVMRHNHVDLNGLPVYGVDSTFIALTGGLDLDSMQLDITLSADSFAPAKLIPNGPFPVYGDLATDIRGRVTGSLDSIVADVDITVLPTTDLTYPIDKKNLAQVKPHGTVGVHYQMPHDPSPITDPLSLDGQINVDDGIIRYSPKAYPMMPFHVDSGSHVAFQGPLGQTLIDVSASQKVKADVESNDEETRRVDFTTGVRVKGELDSIGLQSIGFFLEAPDDETITHELASLDEETREGLAATLLATGMYVGESNVAAQREGYALSSIINSRINASFANSKAGKVVDIDVSSGQSTHASGKTNDMNISVSKSFLDNKLRITLGTTLTDNPEVNQASGLLTNFTADYKLNKDGSVLLRLFSQRDYNNVLEGELYKSGIGVRAAKEWKKKYGLTADAGAAYRSNNSIGPDLTLKSTIKNVFGRGEVFTLKGNGAYYWALRNRHPGDPKKTDTYKLGVNASLIFPYLHWTGKNNPDGDTRYMLGYQYENIAGGYGVHKLSGSFTYFIRSPFNPYITHAFTPFSLSIVFMKAETDSLLDKAAEYPQLIKVIAGNEFVPSVSYDFIYDDYRAKRVVNTFLNLGVKESGNLINTIAKAFGKSPCDQFVKLSAELRNRFNITDKVSIATRLFAGANIPLGKALYAPLSESFYTGGPNSLRAASPYAYGPGNFYSAKYNQNFFHAGDLKLEANFELRFPIVWKLYGAAFLDAGNVWNWYSTVELFKAAGYEDYLERLEIPETLYDGIIHNPEFAKQIALGTGAGLRLDIDGLVVRLDIGVGIHAPYQTFHYDKKGKPDTTRPIRSYFNIPSALDALRINFGIGYPF